MPDPRPVVSNTTPLITLAEVGLLAVIQQLYGALIIPPMVFTEYQRGRAAYPQRPDLQGTVWITVIPAPPDPRIPTSLDQGEREAIALALAQQARLVLIDERQARIVAARLNLVVTGSVGILLEAKRQGIITSVRPYLDTMLAQGRRISPALYTHIIQEAGESTGG